MAGHSKWANIKHRKGAQDAKRGKLFTKVIKEIYVAVKTGGGPDPDSNPRLRAAIQNARSVNMGKDTVEKAIAKASGAGGENLTETTFECYGPSGVAVFVECATDNNTRTVSNIKAYFNKAGGSVGKDGCLQFVFDRKGIFVIKSENISDEDEFTMELIDAGAEDVESDDGLITVTSAMEEFGAISKKLTELNIDTEEAGLKRVPNNTKEIDEKTFRSMMKLIDSLEDDDDVQNVYHNIEFTEELAAIEL